MMSDEFSGEAIDDFYCAQFPCDAGGVRPLETRDLTLEQAIEENARSRIFLGVHWQFDQDTGGALGQEIADNIVQSFPRKAG